MKRALALTILALFALPALAEAKPSICTKKGLVEVLAANDESALEGPNQLLCGDVTGDGEKDAVFTLLSGGTAGTTRFGVVYDGGDELLIRDGYKVTVDIVGKTRFDVQSPFYASDDANCCPSAYFFVKYEFDTFNEQFELSRRSERYKKPKQRFFEGIKRG